NGPGKFDRQQWLGEEGHKTRERFIAGMFGPSATPALQARLTKMMMEAPEVAATDARAAYYDPAIWKEEVLAFPSVHIFAHRTAASQRPYMQAHFPKLEYHEVSDVGHFLMIEKPAEFNRLVLDFLSRLAEQQRRVN